jgi:hypothetical protein
MGKKEKWKPFPLKSDRRQGCLLPLFNIILGFLARIIRQEKEIQEFHIWKEEVKLSLFVDNMTLCLKTPKAQPKNS